jgi:hypothetical protein
VIDELTGDVLDEPLSHHGYQLWTASVGPIIGRRRASKTERSS